MAIIILPLLRLDSIIDKFIFWRFKKLLNKVNIVCVIYFIYDIYQFKTKCRIFRFQGQRPKDQLTIR